MKFHTLALLALMLFLAYSLSVKEVKSAPYCSDVSLCGYPGWWDADTVSSSCSTTYCSIRYDGEVAEDVHGIGVRGTIPRDYDSEKGPTIAALRYRYEGSVPYNAIWQPYNYLQMYIKWWYWLYPDHSYVNSLWSWNGNKSCECTLNWESGTTGGHNNNPTIKPPVQPDTDNIVYLYPPEYRYSFVGPSVQLSSGTLVVGCGWTGATIYYTIYYGKVQGFVYMGGGIEEVGSGGDNVGSAAFWVTGAYYSGASESNPPGRYQQLIVPITGTFHTRVISPYSLYYPYNASDASSYSYTITVNPDAKPYSTINVGWTHSFNSAYGSGGLVGNVSFVKTYNYLNTASMTTANLTGVYRVYYKAEGTGDLWVEKGTRDGWLQLAYYQGSMDLEVKSLDVELKNEPIRIRVRSWFSTTVAVYAAVAQPAPGYRFAGWWTGYARLSSPGQWRWTRFVKDTTVTGSVVANYIVGTLAAYKYEPNLLLRARILTPLPENSWVSDTVQLQGVVDDVYVSPLLCLNGSDARGFAVNNRYVFTAPLRVAATVRTLEGVLNVTLGRGIYRWNQYFSGTYDVIASVIKVGSAWNNPDVDVYVCPSLDAPILRCSALITDLSSGSTRWTTKTALNVDINGYITIYNSGSTGRVNLSVVKLNSTNFVLKYWDVNGQEVEGSTISGLRPSSVTSITACYAPEGYIYHPPTLLINRSIFLPGEGLPNPLLNRKWGLSGLWMVNVTIFYPDRVTDNSVKIHAMLTNGSEVVYIPFSWLKVNMTVDWSRAADSYETCIGSKCVVKWNASSVGIFPQVINGDVPSLYKNWYLVALVAWSPEAVFSPASSTVDISQLWVGNVTYAIYDLIFHHLDSGLKIRQPVMVSQLEIANITPSYRFEEYSPQLKRRATIVSLNVTLTWKYKPPSGVNATLGLPVEELGVSLESYEGGIGFWSYRPASLSEDSVTYSLNLGDSLLFYEKVYPAGLRNSTGSYIQLFQVWVRWQHSLDTASSARLTRYQLSAPVNVTLVPATAVSVTWEADSLSIDWQCFTSGNVGESFLEEAPWRADVIVEIEEWDLKKGSRKLVKVFYFKDKMPEDKLNIGMSTSEKWVAVYLKPVSGVFFGYSKTYIIIPLPVRYPPRL